MSSQSSLLSLPYIQANQAQKHVTHNEAIRTLDVLTHLSVLNATTTTPPAAPAEGDRYLVAAAATDDWAGQENTIAMFTTNGWVFHTPNPGWRADVQDTGDQLRFDGTVWAVTGPDFQNMDSVGINTTADATNRLSVSADTTLLTHDGNDHQLKINKNAAADTSSLLFQTSWSGRAEMGTSGSDDFSIKVSNDGSTFRTALEVDSATGAVRLPSAQNYFLDVFILNDTAYSFEVPWSNPARLMMWLGVNIISHYFLFSITGSASASNANNFATMFANPPSKLNFLSGPLTGTTGPAGSINISLDLTSGPTKMCIENRLGSNRLFTLSTIGK